MFAWLWNSIIRAAGWLTGFVLRVPVRRGWLYFPFVSQWIAGIPFSLGYKFRHAVYRQLLPKIGKDVVLHWGVILEDERSTFGDDVWVSADVYLDFVQIGSHV